MRCLDVLLLVNAYAHAEDLKPQELYKRVLPSLVTLSVQHRQGTSSQGSGFLALKEGMAITAWHVVRDAETVVAKFADGEVFESSGLVDRDEVRDLALIRVKVAGRPLLQISPSQPDVGSPAFVVGAPRGFEFSISDGLVSQVQAIGEHKEYQFTCPASPGNSGGPLLDSSGEVIGVVSWTVRSGQNLNFAIPAVYAAGLDHSLPTTPWADVVSRGAPTAIQADGPTPSVPKLFSDAESDQLLADAFVALAYAAQVGHCADELVARRQWAFRYGVPSDTYSAMQGVETSLAALYNAGTTNEDRAYLLKDLVEKLSKAREVLDLQSASIKAAQRQGGWLGEPNDLLAKSRAASRALALSPRSLQLMRSTASLLDRLPEDLQETTNVKRHSTIKLGVYFLPAPSLLVFKVVAKSLAEDLGIRPGDALRSIDGQPIRSVVGLKRLLAERAGKRVEITVQRDGKERVLKAKVPRDLSRYSVDDAPEEQKEPK